MVRYQLSRILGEGGGGIVYRALDLLTGVEVAIKILHSGLDRARMMRREMDALAAFSHPNIVKLLGTALVGGQPAIVLELAGKGELAQYLRQPLSVSLALGLARQVADALRVIHSTGRVHGDIKPANIFVHDGGALKLGDFGLGNAAGCTVLFSCVAGGTPGYVAPEVVYGHRSTPASDVYSLAVTLFEMLKAIRPRSLCGSGVVSPGTIWLDRFRKDIPEGLSELIARATSLSPQSRPSALDFERSLDGLIAFVQEADAWRSRLPVLKVLRAKARPLGKGMPGLHGMPYVVRGEYFDFVTQSPWHSNHRIQIYHVTMGISGPMAEKIGEPFSPAFSVPAGRTIRVFMGKPPRGSEPFSLDSADRIGFDYQLFLGCGHALRDDGADAIFLVDTNTNQTIDFGIYREAPGAGELLVRLILRPYLPTPNARPVGVPLVAALPAN